MNSSCTGSCATTMNTLTDNKTEPCTQTQQDKNRNKIPSKKGQYGKTEGKQED
jgi:hypothetical protein